MGLIIVVVRSGGAIEPLGTARRVDREVDAVDRTASDGYQVWVTGAWDLFPVMLASPKLQSTEEVVAWLCIQPRYLGAHGERVKLTEAQARAFVALGAVPSWVITDHGLITGLEWLAIPRRT